MDSSRWKGKIMELLLGKKREINMFKICKG